MAGSDPQPETITAAAAHASRVHLGVGIPLLTIGLAIYFVRMWFRIRPAWRVGAEDYCITVGVAVALVDFGFLLPRLKLSEGTLSADHAFMASKYSFLAIPIWGIAMMFIKSSISLLLLKIELNYIWWRIFCWFMITIQVAYGVGNTFFILLQCRPLDGAWDPRVVENGGECLPVSAIIIASNVGSGVNISTDIILSFAPLAFLWKLRRPLREKLLIGFLMGLGTFASAASIVKAFLIKDHAEVEDSWARLVSIGTWTMLEQLLAMIVASAPYLKPVLQKTLQAFGVSVTESTTAAPYGTDYAASRRRTFTTPRAGEWAHFAESRDGVAASDEIPLDIGTPGAFTKDSDLRHDVHAVRSSRSGSASW